MIKGIVFDKDGTIFDTEWLAIRSWKKAASEAGYTVTDELCHSVIGTDSAICKRKFLDALGEDFDYDNIKEKRISYSREYILENGVPLKDGLFEVLDFLKQQGIKLAIATSTESERALFNLKRAELIEYFDAIICGDMIENGKPEPDIFLKAISEIGLKPEECLVVEDSPYGIMGAKKSGALPVLIPDLVTPTDEILKLCFRKLDKLTDVISLVKELNI